MDREDTHEQDARDHRRAPVASPDPGREHREADDRAERGHGDRQLEGALGFIRSELPGCIIGGCKTTTLRFLRIRPQHLELWHTP